MSGKILIIDDDPKNIFALAATLKAKGFQCLSSLSAKEGIALLKSDSEIKLLLLDMMMPDIDGYEAIALIKGDDSIAGVPIIAVTAQAMVGDKEKCLEAGADDYISKPIDVDRLLEVVYTKLKE